jgi:outer membrane immunogenic protein
VNAGYGGGDVKYPFSGTADIAGTDPVGGRIRQSSSGGLVGGQIGYNLEWPGGLVTGLETDLDATNIRDKAGYYSQDSLNDAYSATAKSNLDYFGTVRARVGKAMFGGRFLPYVTGGFAYGGLKTTAGYDCSSCSGGAGYATPVLGVTGWTAGAGTEYALDKHLSFKVEYLYADFGSRTVADDVGQITVPGATLYNATAQVKTDDNMIRIGLNYRF